MVLKLIIDIEVSAYIWSKKGRVLHRITPFPPRPLIFFWLMLGWDRIFYEERETRNFTKRKISLLLCKNISRYGVENLWCFAQFHLTRPKSKSTCQWWLEKYYSLMSCGNIFERIWMLICFVGNSTPFFDQFVRIISLHYIRKTYQDFFRWIILTSI